jgi:hypothetical protein
MVWRLRSVLLVASLAVFGTTIVAMAPASQADTNPVAPAPQAISVSVLPPQTLVVEWSSDVGDSGCSDLTATVSLLDLKTNVPVKSYDAAAGVTSYSFTKLTTGHHYRASVVDHCEVVVDGQTVRLPASSDSAPATLDQYLPVPSVKNFSEAGVTLTGTVMVGKKLIAHMKDFVSGAKFTFSWLRDGKTIKGKSRTTSKTYKLVKSDVGHRISVKTTASKANYKSATVTSAKTAKIVYGIVTGPEGLLWTGVPKVGATVSLVPTSKSWMKGAKVTYEWSYGSAGHWKLWHKTTRWPATTTIPAAARGKKMLVTEIATKKNYATATLKVELGPTVTS